MEGSDFSPPNGEPLPPASRHERGLLLATMAIIIIVDQLTKRLVEAQLPLYTSWAPFPSLAGLFRFTHATNTGAAFGLFPDGSFFFGLVAAGVAIAILAYNFTLPGGQWGVRVALGLQLGGALGNLADRLRQGHVTDFFDFGPWPVFNLADMAIVLGVVLLGWMMLREQRAAAAPAQTHDRPAENATLGLPADEWSPN